jgi:hypothetical protein
LALLAAGSAWATASRRIPQTALTIIRAFGTMVKLDSLPGRPRALAETAPVALRFEHQAATQDFYENQDNITPSRLIYVQYNQ